MWSVFKPCSIRRNALSRSFSLATMRLCVVREDHVWPGGEEHYGFKYYPRRGEVTPNIKPSKLFMVQRIKSLFKEPYWVKDIIAQLKLETDVDKAVVLNTPEMNKLLWEVKHIIKITPITFPYGEPKDGDKGYLNDKGQYILFRNLGTGDVDDKRLEASHKFWKDPSRIDANTLKKKLRDKWLASRN